MRPISMEEYDSGRHTHEEDNWPEYDARGIYLKTVCVACEDVAMLGFRPQVLDDPNYDHEEPIEPDDY